MIYEFQIYKKKNWIGDHILIMFCFSDWNSGLNVVVVVVV